MAQAAACGVDATGEQDGKHSFGDAQDFEVGGGHGERGAGDPGVFQVLVANLGARAAELLSPGRGVGLGECEFGAQPPDEQLVEVGLVDHVCVERGGSGVERARQLAHGQRLVASVAMTSSAVSMTCRRRDRGLAAPRPGTGRSWGLAAGDVPRVALSDSSGPR